MWKEADCRSSYGWLCTHYWACLLIASWTLSVNQTVKMLLFSKTSLYMYRLYTFVHTMHEQIYPIGLCKFYLCSPVEWGNVLLLTACWCLTCPAVNELLVLPTMSPSHGLGLYHISLRQCINGTRERVVAPKRLWTDSDRMHADSNWLINSIWWPFQDEISHWCKLSFGHNVQSKTTLFPLWSFILTAFCFKIPFWVSSSKMSKIFEVLKGKHGKMISINASELILHRPNESFT